ncbi:MAG TPA: acyl carrier protein [Streptosporangiaceae bacterium]|jgi:acyl carrier protein|nr:acyl carrier protein [Streptosporangiaceae bacterium]
MSILAIDRVQRVNELACTHLELDPGEITDTALFIEDYGVDSLSIIDFTAAIEKEFSIAISREALPELVNLAAVYELLANSPVL